jgi:hypothetical protein
MKDVKIMVTVRVPDITDDVDVLYRVIDVLDFDEKFERNAWEVTGTELDGRHDAAQAVKQELRELLAVSTGGMNMVTVNRWLDGLPPE